nr:50S ribosomal protein L35ae [Candidatus Njordarchaeum guaymaensis]
MSQTLKGTKGTFYEYARSRRVQQNNFILIKFLSIKDFSQAARLIGRTVAWESPSGHKLRGKIVSTHGKNGAVKAKFEHGLPANAIGTEVIIE